MLILAALTPAMAAAQPTPQPIFTELFAYDPGEPSQLLGKWRISSQLDSRLQPLRVGVVEDQGPGPWVTRALTAGTLETASAGTLKARSGLVARTGNRVGRAAAAASAACICISVVKMVEALRQRLEPRTGAEGKADQR